MIFCHRHALWEWAADSRHRLLSYEKQWCIDRAGTGTDEVQAATVQTLKEAQEPSSAVSAPVASWEAYEGDGIAISHRQPVSYLTWHAKGDYFASVAPTGEHPGPACAIYKPACSVM